MANPKTTIVGVARDALSLTYKASRIALRGTGKVLAYAHKGLDMVQDGYINQRTKTQRPYQPELPLKGGR
jgi:hypothetical protein